MRKQYSPLNYFLLVFPPLQLQDMVRLTNLELTTKNAPPTTVGKILKWIGILILATPFEFIRRRSLWSTGTTGTNKYIPAACFGNTGMICNRFDVLWSNICYSQQLKERPQRMFLESYRWMRVDGFVRRFNDYRQDFYSPSENICVDESISRWYGQGGHWINIVLPCMWQLTESRRTDVR